MIYQARGVNKNDEWLRVVSLCLWALRSVLTRVGEEYEVPRNGTLHTSPHTQKDIDSLTEYLLTHSVQSFCPGRGTGDDVLEARDFYTKGVKYSNSAKAFKTFFRDARKAFYNARPASSQMADEREPESESESESEPEPEPEPESEDESDEELTQEDLEGEDPEFASTIAAVRDLARSLDLGVDS